MRTVYVSIGSNIHRKKHVQASVDALTARFGGIELSSIYETEAVGFGGDPFYNLVARFEADDSARGINQFFKEVEAKHGRVKGGKKFAARTLDIDLILYGDERIDTEELQLPRDEIEKYAFVLEPLAELAPTARYMISGETFLDMWERLKKQGDMASAPTVDWAPSMP